MNDPTEHPERIAIDLPQFAVTTRGFNGGIAFGNIEVLSVSLQLAQVDPSGELRAKIAAVLNADHDIRMALLRATYGGGITTSAVPAPAAMPSA